MVDVGPKPDAERWTTTHGQVSMKPNTLALIRQGSLGRTLHARMDNLNPTGSFKDQGASAPVSLLKAQKINRIHDDSSGNAGAALAAYVTKACPAARFYTSEAASPRKLVQIELYGAQLSLIAGSRQAAAQATQQAWNENAPFYAGHVYNPFFLLVYKSTAYELWEQLTYREPDIIVMLLRHGTQLLRIAAGFQDLLRAGDIGPAGVQAEVYIPLRQTYQSGTTTNKQIIEYFTLADGIQITHPPRGKQMLGAVTDSNGEIVAISEKEIRQSIQALAHLGILVEPTRAVVRPELKQIVGQLPNTATIVLIITGPGLKAPNLQSLITHPSVN